VIILNNFVTGSQNRSTTRSLSGMIVVGDRDVLGAHLRAALVMLQ
jgi:hypothetical protein